MGTTISKPGGGSTGPTTIVINQGLAQTYAEDGWQNNGTLETIVSSSRIIKEFTNYWLDLSIMTRGFSVGNITTRIYAGSTPTGKQLLLDTYVVASGSANIYSLARKFFVASSTDSETGATEYYIHNGSTGIGVIGGYNNSLNVVVIYYPYLNVTMQVQNANTGECRLGPSRITYG